MGKGPKAYVGSEKRGTSLIGQEGFCHEGQPQGHSIGTGQHEAKIRGMPRGGDPHIFKGMKATLKMSGVKGAHRIGKSK